MRRRAGLAILVVTAATAEGHAADDTTDSTERRISEWNSTQEDGYVPPACLRAEAYQLEGEWTSGPTYASNTLRFTSRGASLGVAFAASLALLDTTESWSLTRTARVKNGAVVLNRAILDLRSIYTTLWPLKVGPYKTVALVPTTELLDVRRAYKVGGCDYFSAVFDCGGCYTRHDSREGSR